MKRHAGPSPEAEAVGWRLCVEADHDGRVVVRNPRGPTAIRPARSRAEDRADRRAEARRAAQARHRGGQTRGRTWVRDWRQVWRQALQAPRDRFVATLLAMTGEAGDPSLCSGRHPGVAERYWRFDAAEPQGVGDHRDRGEAHRGGGDHRRQEQAEEGIEHAGGDRHAERVVDEGEEQVLADVAHRRAATAGAPARCRRRSPLTRVTPALSMATSVPVPMAMPTSAAARAGASLMPSPAIATRRPSALQLGDHGGLALRRDARLDLVDARAARRPPRAGARCRR